MQNTEYIFGIRAIIEAINSGKELEKVYLQKELKGSLMNELNGVIRKNKIANSYVPIEKLNKLSKYQNHQGAVAKISAIKFHNLEELIAKNQEEINKDFTPLYLLLDQISDVRNFGAIIRTAECSNVSGIIIPNHGNAPLNADAIKTSAGAAFNIPICKVEHIKDALFILQASEIQIVSITEKTDDLIYSVDLKKPTALIMGSEHRGISPSVLKISDYKAKLPMYGTIESLNVSVACGIALYEVVRQRL
ncbi:MAG TPA: 23S rRNA (guanosine(2251)-2'-O)-methyltransferase RlmB [Flavobacteriaceae bacterium]|nr:23S rRNA (guanosine(2251)-2'-O)-methyltransferase RlmB [Flavobacteriaceae bacterium]